MNPRVSGVLPNALRKTLIVLSAAAAQFCFAQVGWSPLWQEYTASPDTHPNIPNFSYAGYRCGDSAIPSGNTFPTGQTVSTFNVKSGYGAKGDGITDDTTSIKNAITAASANGGVVYFPAGTYQISNVIQINGSRVILRGAGQGQTILRFTRSRNAIQGGFWPDSGGLITFGSGFNFQRGVSISPYNLYPNRGGRTIQVDHPQNIRFDQKYIIGIQNDVTDPTAIARMLMGDGEWATTWFNTPEYDAISAGVKGINLFQPIDFTSVNGNIATFRPALRFDMRQRFQPYVASIVDSVNDVGIDNLSVVMQRDYEYFPQDHRYEKGWNGIEFYGVVNGWASNVTITDTDGIGLSVAYGVNITAQYVTVNASAPNRRRHHHAIKLAQANDCLVKNFTVSSKPLHGLSISAYSAGNVFSQGTISEGAFDYHKLLPYENLFTEITIKNDGLVSGTTTAGPMMGCRNVHWNIDGQYSGNLSINEPTWMPSGALVGLRGFPAPATASPLLGNSYARIESTGNVTPTPSNLYLAQYAMRKGLTIPSGGVAVGDVRYLPSGYIPNMSNGVLNAYMTGQDGWTMWEPWVKTYTNPMAKLGRVTTHPDYPGGIQVIQGLGKGTDSRIQRVMDSRWWSTPFTGNETDARMTFDCQGGGQIAMYGSESMQFGYWDAMWTVRGGALLVNGVNVPSVDISIPGVFGEIDKTDWIRIQLRINFRDFNNLGSCSLYYRNLTKRDADFRPVTTVQRVPLLGGIPRPSTWGTLGVFVSDDFCVTNIQPGQYSYIKRAPTGRPGSAGQ